MKVLVVGSLPPPDSDRAKALRSEVARILAEGHTVEVVAPNPVATAHRYLIPTGIPGSLRLATIVGGFDSVVVQLEPGLPVRARAGRLERAASFLAFSLALRRGRDVVIRLEHALDLPGGPGGRAAGQVWRSVGRIEVGGDHQRAEFLGAVGDLGACSVVSSSQSDDVAVEDTGWGEGAEASAENVLELVRARAARERRMLGDLESTHVVGWERLPQPGIAMIDLDPTSHKSPGPSRGLGGLARSALASADRRPLLRPGAGAIRAARRGVHAVLRPEPPG
jgi:hypothetical protein